MCNTTQPQNSQGWFAYSLIFKLDAFYLSWLAHPNWQNLLSPDVNIVAFMWVCGQVNSSLGLAGLCKPLPSYEQSIKTQK